MQRHSAVEASSTSQSVVASHRRAIAEASGMPPQTKEWLPRHCCCGVAKCLSNIGSGSPPGHLPSMIPTAKPVVWRRSMKMFPLFRASVVSIAL